ncbi:hypothetical protein MNBD_ALPHA11-964 [hydrothermal vent metagenome]|uniref:Uncharacterized protein n=1 Tax=hydrothermal vent metagenome TaxID=652676 RepID=A0A3B0U1F7_9ZZZZ
MAQHLCFACGGTFTDIDGPVHAYMASSPGCWAAFGEVLAREYSDAAYFEVHRLSVDAYAVQHPGTPSKQTIGSIGVHLIRLCLFHEYGLTPERANDAMVKASKNKENFIWLEPPLSLGEISVADVVEASGVEQHKRLVRSWAKKAWEAWSVHHEQVRQWIEVS